MIDPKELMAVLKDHLRMRVEVTVDHAVRLRVDAEIGFEIDGEYHKICEHFDYGFVEIDQ